VLVGKERALFVQAASSLAEMLPGKGGLDTGVDWPTGVEVFDRLPVQTRVVLLADVVRALTDPHIPEPARTAFNEAAIYAVFRSVFTKVVVEIDEGQDPTAPFSWRRLILDACQEEHEGNGEHDQEPDPDDAQHWEDLLEDDLADRILWDRNWEDVDVIARLPPAQAAEAIRLARAPDNYFAAAAPANPSPAEERQAREYLDRLAHQVGW
jgi:hypothetical protein